MVIEMKNGKNWKIWKNGKEMLGFEPDHLPKGKSFTWATFP